MVKKISKKLIPAKSVKKPLPKKAVAKLPTTKKVVPKKPAPKAKVKRPSEFTWVTQFQPGDPILVDTKKFNTVFPETHIKQIYFVRGDEILYMTITGLILREGQMKYNEDGKNCFT